MTAAFALVRAVHFLGLMTIFGSEALRALFRARLKPAPADHLPSWVPTVAAGAAFATVFFWLDLTAATMSGDRTDLLDPNLLWITLTQTFFGRVAIARAVLLAALLVSLCWRNAGAIRIALSGAALAAISLTSHAAASGDAQFMAFRAANDAVHLLCAAFWIGGLAVLAPLVVAEQKRPGALVAPLRAFSRWGLAAVSLLVAAGSLNGYFILFGGAGRWSLAYLALLAAKIVLAAVMISLALANRFSLLPGIDAGHKEAEETLPLTVVAELVFGILVIAIVSLLGLLPPRMD